MTMKQNAAFFIGTLGPVTDTVLLTAPLNLC